mgnify:CR=1
MTLPSVHSLIESLKSELQNRFPQADDSIVMVGIHSGGAWIAQTLHTQLNIQTELGSLDISFYRDDFSQNGLHPHVKSSTLPDIEGKTIILIDDVIMSGRTIRAALNELFDYGRPQSVLLACLLDVGQRELPIQADIIAHTMQLTPNQRINLSGPEPLELSLVTLNKEGKKA